MIFFWDRNLGKSIPNVIRQLEPPFGVEVHSEHFPETENHPEGGDDTWMSLLNQEDWFLLTKDHRIHHRKNELEAIKRYGIGCFYLWGRNSPKWDIVQCFMAAAPAIIRAAETTPRPFIYRVDRSGSLSPVPLPLP